LLDSPSGLTASQKKRLKKKAAAARKAAAAEEEAAARAGAEAAAARTAAEDEAAARAAEAEEAADAAAAVEEAAAAAKAADEVAAAAAIARAAAAVRAADKSAEVAAGAGTQEEWAWKADPSVPFAPFTDISSDDEVPGEEATGQDEFVVTDNAAFLPSWPPAGSVHDDLYEADAILTGSEMSTPERAESSEQTATTGRREEFVTFDNSVFSPERAEAELGLIGGEELASPGVRVDDTPTGWVADFEEEGAAAAGDEAAVEAADQQAAAAAAAAEDAGAAEHEHAMLMAAAAPVSVSEEVHSTDEAEWSTAFAEPEAEQQVEDDELGDSDAFQLAMEPTTPTQAPPTVAPLLAGDSDAEEVEEEVETETHAWDQSSSDGEVAEREQVEAMVSLDDDDGPLDDDFVQTFEPAERIEEVMDGDHEGEGHYELRFADDDDDDDSHAVAPHVGSPAVVPDVYMHPLVEAAAETEEAEAEVETLVGALSEPQPSATEPSQPDDDTFELSSLMPEAETLVEALVEQLACSTDGGLETPSQPEETLDLRTVVSGELAPWVEQQASSAAAAASASMLMPPPPPRRPRSSIAASSAGESDREPEMSNDAERAVEEGAQVEEVGQSEGGSSFSTHGWVRPSGGQSHGRVKRASVVVSSAASSASGARSERERRCSQSTGYSDSDEEGVLDHAERPGVEAEAVDAAIALHVGMNTPAGSVHGAVLYYQVRELSSNHLNYDSCPIVEFSCYRNLQSSLGQGRTRT
jgi:hypothetical protein